MKKGGITWLTLKYGALAGMGQHCPIRKLKRRALIALLAAATLCAAITAARSASETAALLSEAQTDRASLLSLLNGASFYEQRPDGTRIYTHAVMHEVEIKPVVVVEAE
ncbi:MAG: hypothetical protein PHD37_17690 [Gallionellaceae bacterium]|nr:hypothetical protein [Gallionellaceae bacterium]